MEMQEIYRHTLAVSEDDDGQRFDRWLKKNVKGMPYGMIQRLIRKRAFRVDGKRAKADTVLMAGQEVTVPTYQAAVGEPDRKPRLSEADARYVRSLVIYDEGGIIALNKPADLAVQGGTKQKMHVDALLPVLADKDGVVPRLVHRLDKDTSGVLLLARSAKMAKAMGDIFKGRRIRKVYWALTSGVPDPREGVIRAPLIKATGGTFERVVVDEEEGKFAETEYVVLDHAHRSVAFVAFWPRTGRMHQIRVHAELMRTPILGDRKYRGLHFDQPPELLEGEGLAEGLHLHAQQVAFTHPFTHKAVDICAPLPPDRLKSWTLLGFSGKYKKGMNPFADTPL